MSIVQDAVEAAFSAWDACDIEAIETRGDEKPTRWVGRLQRLGADLDSGRGGAVVRLTLSAPSGEPLHTFEFAAASTKSADFGRVDQGPGAMPVEALTITDADRHLMITRAGAIKRGRVWTPPVPEPDDRTVEVVHAALALLVVQLQGKRVNVLDSRHDQLAFRQGVLLGVDRHETGWTVRLDRERGVDLPIAQLQGAETVSHGHREALRVAFGYDSILIEKD